MDPSEAPGVLIEHPGVLIEHPGVFIEHPGGAQWALFGSWFVWEPIKASVDRDSWHFLCAVVDVEALGGIVARSHQHKAEKEALYVCPVDVEPFRRRGMQEQWLRRKQQGLS